VAGDADHPEAAVGDREAVPEAQVVPGGEHLVDGDLVVGGGGAAARQRPGAAGPAGHRADQHGRGLVVVQLEDGVQAPGGHRPVDAGGGPDGRFGAGWQLGALGEQDAGAGREDPQGRAGRVLVLGGLRLDAGPQAAEQQDQHQGQADADHPGGQPARLGQQVTAGKRHAAHSDPAHLPNLPCDLPRHDRPPLECPSCHRGT
jgi:hypothetical protein